MSVCELPKDVVPIIRYNTSRRDIYERLVLGDNRRVYFAQLSKNEDESGNYLSRNDEVIIERALEKSGSIDCSLLLFLHDKDEIIDIRVAKCVIKKGYNNDKDRDVHEYEICDTTMSWYLHNRDDIENRYEHDPAILNIVKLLSFTSATESNGKKKDGKYILLARSKSLAEAVRLLTFDASSQHVYWCSDAIGSERLFSQGASDSRDGSVRKDYGRIVQSRAFRRMVDKAQIYGAERGVHYRTRMTHTLVVARIAREIAARLGGDELLAETIALAHDLGHTPFGHQGERTIKEMLEKHCGPCFGGGFKHNYQSVRVLSLLEEGYPGFAGLNVSWKVLEGALHHTKTLDKKGEPLCNFFELDPMYLHNKDWFDTYVVHKVTDANQSAEGCEDCRHSWTLEGQIVAMADEIAQRSHDIDDGIMSGRIHYEEILELLGRFGLTSYQNRIRQAVDDVKSVQYTSSGQRYASEVDVLRSVVSEEVMQILIDDVCEESKVLVDNTSEDADGFLKGQLIEFSNTAAALNSCLEGVIKRRVLSSCDVAEFDINAHKIVCSLYEQFLRHPDLLPEEVLIRYRNMQSAAGLRDVLDFSNCDFDARRYEIKLINEYGSMLTAKTISEKEYFEKKRDLELRGDLAFMMQKYFENETAHSLVDGSKMVEGEAEDFLWLPSAITEAFTVWGAESDDVECERKELQPDPLVKMREWDDDKWKLVGEIIRRGNSLPIGLDEWIVDIGDSRNDIIKKSHTNKRNQYGAVSGFRYIIKWLYLNRVIADYLADMTDTMAKDEYERVCHYR